MEQKFIQYTARHNTQPGDTILMIRPLSNIAGVSPSLRNPDGCTVYESEGEMEAVESIEYFQNLLKPLGWEQK